ncbi:MAG: maltose alpha-D-glucosyltransferase [Acidobacteria bacterium]|nr:MAG: maltose alpha-D-glucosyltransferase [Acidobacteriota bacterium]
MSTSAAPAPSLWFKNAVIYEVPVRAFADWNGDGIGDFRGLIDKLDYLQWLGVDCLWLLPFYPSPLRDDGYDIADFHDVDPDYGTLEDFRELLEEAHARGMRVLADLVLNHTSDQHPWFQQARSSADSPYRNWYVWSSDPHRYAQARIIFTDTEVSNWTWDPVANAYFWHRFYSHQPDLNYEEPAVRKAMIETVFYWLDLGLDGFRCDAVPYLFEREQTICENLPQTHAFLQELRRQVDARYGGDRILLAEANQWPSDVVRYFGQSQPGEPAEFHMAFHFPLMPRLFMAVRQETRRPIVDILAQTPPIPENCQWGLFLRNHDELTLEMCTDEERDYMYYEYAREPRMKLNLGIRRRLAPIVDNSRREIELMNVILFSMPGTPILYYGDEIGMGDNIYLSDRNGVRTPMQWNIDRNGGFSKAPTERLYAPLIQNPIYSFQAVNVERQFQDPNSLLNWMKSLLKLRHNNPLFGWGGISFLTPGNERVLVYLRRLAKQSSHSWGEMPGARCVLVVANLSRHSQAVELDLSSFAGWTPHEMFGETVFPAIATAPYQLSLGAYGYYWFRLEPPGGSDVPAL